MKKSFFNRLCIAGGKVLFFLSAASAAAAPAKLFVPDSSLNGISVPSNLQEYQSISFAVREGIPCLETAWKNLKHPWSRLDINRPLAGKDFTSARISVPVYLPAAAGDLNLRFSDRTGETFQFRQMLKKQKGWQTVVFEVDAGKIYKGSWGGNKDGKPDLPLTFRGFSFAVKQTTSGIAFGKILLETPVSDAVFTVFSPVLKTGQLTKPADVKGNWLIKEAVREEKKCIEIAWSDFSAPWSRVDTKRDFISKPIASCRIFLDVYLADPAAGKDLNLRLEDRFGEVFQIRQVLKKQKGWQTLVYELDSEKSYKGTWGGRVNGKLDFPLILRGFSFATATASGSIGIGEAVCEITSGPCMVEILTGNPIHILHPGKNIKPELSLRNWNSTPLRLKGKCVVKNASGKVLADFSLPTELPAKTAVKLPLPEITNYDIRYCNVTVDDGIHPPETRKMSYAAMLPSGPTPGLSRGFHFGVHSHAESYTAADRELTALAAGMCGAKVFRMGSCWRQPSETAPVDWSVGEQLMEIFARQNMEPQIICGGWLPLWAVEKDKPLFRDFGPGRMNHAMFPKLDKWGNWITRFLEHYKGKVRFMEAWNEPDLVYFGNFSVADYIRLQKHFYNTCKKVSPKINVMTGGYALLEMKDARYVISPDYIRETLQGSKGFYDIIAYHGHGPQAAYDGEIRGLNRIREDVGVSKVPWWSNETAISSAVIGERAQAETLFKKLLFCWANGGIGYTWYNIRNKGYDPLNGEDNFGLVTKDFYPKQVYLTYNMLTRVYRNARFLKTLNDKQGFQVYLFRAENGDYLIPCWNVSGNRFQLLALGGIEGKVSVIDLFGNEKTISTSDGLCLIPAGTGVQTVRISGQNSSVQYIPDLLRLPEKAFIRPDQKNTVFQVQISNPLNKELNGSIAIKAPAGSTIVPAEKNFRLAPRKQAVLDFKLDPGKNAGSGMNNLCFPGTLILNGTALADFNIELRPVLSLKPDFPAEPDFILDKGEQILPRFVNEPSNAHLVWRGKEDVSAKIYLASDQKYFHIKVVVKDDIYAQKFHGGEMWKGDSIQVALWLPGQEDMWEFGASHGNGKPEKWVWWAPQRSNAPVMTGKMQVKTMQNHAKSTTTYIMSLPLDELGVTPEMQNIPFPLGILVNDNDGTVRESSMLLAPGFGGGLRIPDLSPLISF